MRLWISALLAMCLSAMGLWAMAPLAMAQGSVVIYRCTNASGVVTLQNDVRCPKGSREQKRVVDTAASAAPFPKPLTPAPAASTPPPAPDFVTVQPPAATAAVATQAIPEHAMPLPLPDAHKPLAERLPPPPLFECRTADNDSYLSDTAEPKPRCVRISTVGIDGSQQRAAGEACSMVYDQCQRIPDNAACPAWRIRVNQAQSAWTFARADMSAQAKADYERIARVLAETTCNQ